MNKMSEGAREENMLSALASPKVRGSARSEALADAAAYLSTVAAQLDKWAEESKSGGWSTHQVDGNIALSNGCRRMADRLRALQ